MNRYDSKRKKGFAASIVILALGLIFIGGALVVNVVGPDWDFGLNWGERGISWSGGERYENEYTETIDLHGENEITIDTLNGMVSVTGWNEDYVSIEISQYIRSYEEESVTEGFEITKPQVSSSGNDLEIRVPRVAKSRELTGYGVNIVAKVPYEIINRVDVKTSNGKMEFINLNADINGDSSNGKVYVSEINGSIYIDTSNGGMDISDVTGDVEFNSSNGGLEGYNLEGYLKARTSNSSIELRNSTLEIDAKTSNGNITIENSRLTGTNNRLDSSNGRILVDSELPSSGTVELDSSNGKITMRIPEDTKASIDADTSNGSVQIIDFPISISKMDKTSLVGNINGGGDLDISIRTSNASIIIEKQ